MTAAGQMLAVYTQLMAINMVAFAAGQYAVAYHALVAALHCAQDLRDSVRVVAVLQRADEQRTEIDRLSPGAYPGTQPSEWQRRLSGYRQLAHQAQEVDLLLQRQQ